MATTYSDQIGQERPDRYTDDIWTSLANNADMISRITAGYLAIAQGDAAYTLKDIAGNRESRTLALKFTSTLTVARVITIDTTTSGLYKNRLFIIWNASAGNFKLTIKTSAGGSTGVDINSGFCRAVWHDGTNVYALGPEVSPTTGLVASASLPVAPSARVYHSTTQSLANNTYAILAFNSERWDTDTLHDNSTNNSRLTCKTPGLYRITAQVGFAAHATGYRIAALYLGGATVIGNQGGVSLGAVDPTVLTVSTEYPLLLNEYVEVLGYQNSGGALNAVSLPNQACEFMMTRISA